MIKIKKTLARSLHIVGGGRAGSNKMSILQQAEASMNPTTFSTEFLEKQFAKMNAQELKEKMKIGGEDLTGDYTKDEMIQLILWGNRPSSHIRGSFHAWIGDKKKKNPELSIFQNRYPQQPQMFWSEKK